MIDLRFFFFDMFFYFCDKVLVEHVYIFIQNIKRSSGWESFCACPNLSTILTVVDGGKCEAIYFFHRFLITYVFKKEFSNFEVVLINY